MAASKDLRGVSVKKALHKAEKANKNPNAKKAVNAKKTTSLKATAVKPARFNRGVAGVAVASTLAMMLPSAAASALQINQQNIVDSANVVSKAGKGNLRSQELNMLRWGVGARRESRQTKAFVEIARRAIEAQKQRENVENVQNTQPAISSEDFNGDKSATPTKTSEIKNTTSDSKANVNSSENTASATESANPPASAQSSEPAKVKQSEVKPVDTPAVNQPVQPTTKPESAPTAKQDEKNTAEVKQQEVNAGEVKPAENKQPENAESSKPASEQNTNAQPSSTHAENTNTVSAANAPKVRKPRSAENNGGDNSGSSVPTTTTSAPASPAASSANNAPASTAAAPAGNTPAQSTPVTPASAESNAGAGTTASTSADTTAQYNRQKQSAESSTQGTQGSTQGSQTNTHGANTSGSGANINATPSTNSSNSDPQNRSTQNNNPTPSPASTSTPNAGTQNAGSATTNNTATDPNSQVIKPNEQHPTAGSTSEANSQVQTDKKPEVTYNLQIRYTIGGAANKQLVQPYELTIDVEKLNKLDDVNSYEYIELPKAAGYRPSVYHSGDYQYYVKKVEGDKSKFVIDDGTDADAVRYLRLSKKLITDYAVKERPAVGGNNVAQAPQTSQSTNPQSSSSSQPKADDGIQYYGELNINYAPKTAKYYVRHLVQKLDNKDEFEEAPNIGKAIVVEHKTKDKNNNITITKEVIHVTEITGTVGSNVTAVSTYIRGYEPEHNLISSPLSDSEDESDKLVLNLRYYRKAYEVTYDSAGGTDVTAQKVYYGQKVPEVPEPTYRGHKFLGWQVVKPGDSSSSGPLIKGTSTNYKMPDHNVQFRAAWSANAATSYRVNVWVQKADLVDKEHPDSLANYDFVGLVERKNVQTDSDVALDKMNDAGVVDDASKLNGKSKDDYVKNPELGLTREELQGTEANKYKDGLIEKFNWMNDTHVTNLDGYDTENPGDAKNKGKDLFTRYFHVNKKLTKELNSEQHDFVPGRPDLGKRSKSQLCADDLNNTLNLVYDRKEYELIFAKPAGLEFINSDAANNAAIKKKDEHGKTTIYCYAGGGKCSEKYDGKDDDNGTEINHKGYRVNVRYGQKLTDIWPGVEEIDLSNDISDEDKAFLGWRIGYAGDVKYLDTPPYRFTKEEFADPSLRAMGKNQAPKISDDPEHNPQTTHELKDNQRLLTADTTGANKDMPYTVIIKKQSIASAKNGDTGDDIKYVLSTDSYSKDDVNNTGYTFTAPSIAGFDSVSSGLKAEQKDRDDFNDDSEALYEASSEYKKDSEEWDKLTDDDEITEAQAKGLLNFRKKYHIKFRDYLGPAPSDSDEDPDAAYGPDAPSDNYEKNAWLEMKYKRQSYDVQFYNADGNAIKDDSGAATEELPFEYSLTKRGKKDLTGEDEKLYGSDTSYDASVTKDDAKDTSKQFDGKYTFTLNGTKYSIVRPNNLPKDYVFKGWALDQAGTRFINGEDKDITVPVNGIKLYAAWGAPTDIQHTVTFDYNMPKTDENGNEIGGSDVVTEKKFDHYKVIDEKKITIPTRKGYDFYGWELVKKGNEVVPANTPYAFGNKVVEDITLKAVWVEDTRYNGTFKHIFLKPGYTIADYKTATDAAAKAAMVDHVSEQTVSGLREHLRYNAEAVYSDETHFPDKHFTSFEASSEENNNTGEFIYQTYNTRKYKVRYVTIGEDGKEKDLLPESEVSSVNRKYDVAFYKPIEGFMPETTQQIITYDTDDDGKQKDKDIRTFTFKYKDVRVLKRQDDAQARPDHYTRYVFQVDNKQSSMGSVVDWQGNNVADGSALVYDAIKGTKAYQMPLPTVKAKPGFEFEKWTSEIYIDDGNGGQTVTGGFDRLPILSESQPNPKVVYTVHFKLKSPVAIDTKVLKPTDALSLDDNSAKELIKNADKYPGDAKFSFVQGEKFDNTPGLHKIKVQVKLDGNTAETEVLYRVLPDLVYASDWDKFSQSDYGKRHVDNNEYVKVTFTGDWQQGRILGHDGETSENNPALVAYVYKGKKDISVRVPQAFGKEYEDDHYHYVFKGWTTSTETDPAKITNYDIKSEDRYKTDTFSNDVTYHAVYKKIDYFSSSSDGGEVPKDAVVAIFKPAPGRLWKDGTSGPKVFYVKKGTDISQIPYSSSNPTNALEELKANLTNATGIWKRSSMLNDGKKVTEVKDVAKTDDNWKDGWKVNESFQEFVADQKDWTEPDVQTDYLVAVQGKRDTLPALDDYLTNLAALKKEAETKGDVKDITIEYDLPKGKKPEDFENKMLKKPSLYTVPLKITVNYKDGVEPKKYKRVARLKVIYQLMYPDSLPKKDNQSGSQTGANAELAKVLDSKNYVQVNFKNAQSDGESPNGKGEFAAGSRDLYYAYKQSASGVKAPQAVGKDYDEKGYHYVFKGWQMDQDDVTTSVLPVVTLFAAVAPTPTTVQTTPPKTRLYSNAEIAGMKFDKNTTFTAVYEKMENVIDASQQDKIPDGYVATIFLPEIGHRWSNGEYKPKLLYIRHGKDITDNIKFSQKVADNTGKLLSGFVKWRMYDAKGNESNVNWKHAWDIATPRIFVAEQSGISDIKIPETVIGVGDAIPNLNKLVHNTDPNVNVSINRVDGQGEKPKDADNTQGAKDYNTYVYQPGTATVTVDVTRPTDEVDPKTKERKTITTQIQVRLHVLPNVIADNDLPAEGTAEAKFVQKNYAKVTYAAGDGGEMKSSVFTYWVRKGTKDLHMPVPDVLADKGYVFKDWTSSTTETPAAPADKRKATDEEREALARMAIMSGKTFVANVIRRSHTSTLAALQHLLEEAQKVKNDPIATDDERESIALYAESDNKPWVAKLIRNSRHSTVEALNNLLKIAKVNGEREILALMAEHENKFWVASIIRKSHNSKIESLKLLLKNAGVDPDKPHDYSVDMSGIIDEKREVLAELADDANKTFVAKIIRSSKKSSLEDLKQLLRNAGVNPEISLPEPQPTRETTITANFELMKPMRFEFRSSAISGIPATFTLTNLTENSSGNTTVKVDNTNFTINNFISDGGSNGLLPSCTGTTCKISGTPKIVDGKPKVEVKFITVDQYGRRAEIVVYIDIVDSAKPSPAPVPTPPAPAPVPTPEIPFVPDFAPSVIPEAQVMQPEPEEPQPEPESKPALAKTGSNVAQSAILASLLASVGLAGFAAKHRRKREDGKNN